MILHHVALIILLTISATTALFNCSGKQSCYAEDPTCDPNTNCQTVLHFDSNNNLDISVRNVTITDYVAIVSGRDMLDTKEYFICVPFAGQRLRAIGRTGQVVLINQQIMTNVVARLDTNKFQCFIDANELPPDFRYHPSFTISRGRFQQFLAIDEGFKLYKVTSKTGMDEVEEGLFVPVVYKVAAPIVVQKPSFYSTDDNWKASKAILEIEEMVGEDEEDLEDLEKLIISKHSDSDEKKKKMIMPRRHQKPVKKTSSTYQDDQHSMDHKDDEKHDQKESHFKRSAHRHHHHDSQSDKPKNVTMALKSDHEMSHKTDDADEKVYVLMTKQQMYEFVDRQTDRQVRNPESVTPKRNHLHHYKQAKNVTMPQKMNKEMSSQKIDDGDEKVYVLMSKRQMHEFVDRHAERQVREPESAVTKRNNSIANSSFVLTIVLVLLAVLAY